MEVGISVMLLAIGLLLVLNVYLLQDIKDLIREAHKEENKTKQFKREHTSISKTNFGSVLNGRTDVFAKYRNNDGLYEPVKTKNGIELRRREE